jgi:hypothetical protein
MARFNTNVSAKSHERVKLGGFRGIDTSSAPIEVENYRSTEMRNMISRNGLNRKRHGWAQQELNINKTYPNTFGGAVQGIYGFKFAGETETRTMVYANCRLWHQTKKGDPFVDVTPNNVTTLKDRPCQFYLIGDALYILGCGEFFVVERGENNGITVSLMSDRAYVPTTMLKIASDQYNASTTEPIERVTFEPPNMLTPWRINTFLPDDKSEKITELVNVEVVNLKVGTVENIETSFEKETKTYQLDTDLKVDDSYLPNLEGYTVEKLDDVSSAYLIKKENNNVGWINSNGKLEFIKSNKIIAQSKFQKSYTVDYNLGGALQVSTDGSSYTPSVNPTVTYNGTNKKYEVGSVYLDTTNYNPSVFIDFEIFVRSTKVDTSGSEVKEYTLTVKELSLASNSANDTGSNSTWNFEKKENGLYEITGSINKYIDGNEIFNPTIYIQNVNQPLKSGIVKLAVNNKSKDIENIDYVISKEKEDTDLYESKTPLDSSSYELEIVCYPPSGITSETIGIEFTLTGRQFYYTNEEKEIYLEFKKEIPNYKERITQCAISTLFGVDGHSDRLFVAGNENVYGDWASNCVVQWSEIDNYTYFPDVNYTRLGTQATAINGMQRLNDDSLCLFKEASTTEPTIYVMYGEYNTDKEGNTTNIFRTYAGNVAEGLIAPNSTGNLAGDILMLSSNGVYGVEMDANVVSTSKYTKERGLPIKRFIKEYSVENLKKACSIVRDDRYILCIGDKCFVAESRYSYKPKGSPRDTFSYEWYVWDNIPALCFSEIDGELYFGTADGKLCKFDDKFTDRRTDYFGATTINIDKGVITVSGDLLKGDILEIKNELYGIIANSAKLVKQAGEAYVEFQDEKEFFIVEEDGTLKQKFFAGQNLYWAYPYYNTIYSLKIEDVDNINLRLIVSLVGSGVFSVDNAEILYPLQNQKMEVDNPDINPDAEGKQASLKINGIPIKSFKVKERPNKWEGCRYSESNVVAEWYSNTIDFGVPDYSKTLLGFTVVPERIEGDSVQFGYITREVDNESDVKQLRKSLTTVTENPLNLDGLSLYLLSFNTFQTSFTKKVKVRNFNYLMWFFKSDSPTDTAINNVLFDYKINHKNKGVN